MIYLKQSTASQEVPLGPFVDATDGDTAMTGLTIANTDIKLWVAGATTLANKNSGGATHISGGIYYAVLDATDTATLGSLVIFVHVATALAVRVECVVLAANVYDSLIGGGDLLDVSVTQLGGVAQSLTDLKDFADTGYDPAAHKVETVKVNDQLSTAQTEPTGVPAANETPLEKLGFMFAALRNRVDVTGTKKTFYDDSNAALWEKDLTDDGATYSESEGNAP